MPNSWSSDKKHSDKERFEIVISDKTAQIFQLS